MSTFKRTKVIMLPAKEGVTGDFITNNGRLFWHPHKAAIAKAVDDYKYQSQHLYFLSDDEIKEGDWILHEGNPIFQFNENQRAFLCHECKKIIATTDTSLIYHGTENMSSMMKHSRYGNGPELQYRMPEPSQGFIQKYCEKGGIDEVMVEYETSYLNWKHSDTESLQDTLKPKVSSDNTITIRPIKDSWSREEVLAIIDEKIKYLSDGNDMKSTSEIVIDENVIWELRKLRKHFE